VAEAVLYGIGASSALIVGALVGVLWRPRQGFIAAALAFASGALAAAVSVELFSDAYEKTSAVAASAALLVGAVVFVAIDAWLDKRIARTGQTGFALAAAVTLDGVPENLALGVSLAESGSIVLLVAIFVSNLPESLAGARAMREDDRSRRFVLLVWGATALLLAAAVVIGRGALAGASPEVLAIPLAFAGGAVLASLADTLMPDAYRRGGPWVAIATALGFLVSFALSEVEQQPAPPPPPPAAAGLLGGDEA
jgi:zinc transporter, ZIP family